MRWTITANGDRGPWKSVRTTQHEDDDVILIKPYSNQLKKKIHGPEIEISKKKHCRKFFSENVTEKSQRLHENIHLITDDARKYLQNFVWRSHIELLVEL